MSLIVDDGAVLINNNELSVYGVYLSSDGISVGEAELSTAFVDVPARWGAYDLSATDTTGRAVAGRREITLNVAATVEPDTRADVAEMDIARARREIGALHGAECTVTDIRQGLTWTGRMSVGEWVDVYDAGQVLAHATCELKLTADPCAISDTCSVAVNGSTSVLYGGNVVSAPIVQLVPASAGQVAFSINSVTWSATVSSTSTVYVDCGRAWAHLADNSAVVPNLIADWPCLVPGANAFTVTNCTLTVTYDERVMV